jgi:hypothetical protein
VGLRLSHGAIRADHCLGRTCSTLIGIGKVAPSERRGSELVTIVDGNDLEAPRPGDSSLFNTNGVTSSQCVKTAGANLGDVGQNCPGWVAAGSGADGSQSLENACAAINVTAIRARRRPPRGRGSRASE